MPIYVYEIVTGEPDDGLAADNQIVDADASDSSISAKTEPVLETFEISQRITDPPLTVHPETGQPVRRVIQPSFIGGSWSDGAMHKNTRDDKKLDRLGFTKYVKAGDGYYEKRAGKGPNIISADRPISPSDLKSFD